MESGAFIQDSSGAQTAKYIVDNDPPDLGWCAGITFICLIRVQCVIVKYRSTSVGFCLSLISMIMDCEIDSSVMSIKYGSAIEPEISDR